MAESDPHPFERPPDFARNAMNRGSPTSCARWNEHVTCVRPIYFVYWAYSSAEYWPTEGYLCTTCADAAVDFLNTVCKPGDLAAFSRELVDAPALLQRDQELGEAG